MSNCLCLACHRPNPLTAKFCDRCGARLQIQDRYRALRVIGQGAFGKTFLSQDEGKPSQPKCVIKQFIYNDPTTRQKALELFEEEAKRLDALGQHPQIPELLAHCQQDGQSYLVQQYIDGENLNKELIQKGAFSEQQIREVLTQLLPVLDFIHGKNVIHRDIKPENIMRRHSDNQLILVDFGAAKHATASALAKTGTTIGSASYASPEQTKGRAVFASDLYGLGVTCLHLLTGVDPFDLFDDLTFNFAWRDFLSGKRVSDQFGTILDKMTQQRLIDRYVSANDILQALGVRSTVSSKSTTTGQAPSTTIGINSQSQQTSNRSFAETFKNGLPSGSTGLEMVSIPAGSFMMGGTHHVKVQAFYIGKYQITQAQYEAVMGNNPSHFKGENLPVEQVSWHEAVAFCQKLSQQTGKQYRLPSEAEWEYACCAGNSTKYCFGDSDNQLKNYAWYKDNSDIKTHPVGEKLANALGLHDMHGNVWEWCADNWESNLSNLPQNSKALINSGDSSRHPVRGGSWNYLSDYCRSGSRNGILEDFRYEFIGFRVVCVSNTTSKAPSPNTIKVKTIGMNSQSQQLSSQSFTEICGSIELKMVLVPAGSFLIGGKHRVSIPAFYMGKYQITQEQYGCVPHGYHNPSKFKGNDQCPVEHVYWENAVAFCIKLSHLTGKRYRLPSEAEWEYACRAGSTTKYCFGDSDSQLKDYAWYDNNSGGKTHPVGQKKANAWGLHDMHGNVWEWCADNWVSDLSRLPINNEIFRGGDSSRHPLRGGSWISNSGYCCSDFRQDDSVYYRNDNVGFRVVCNCF